VICSLNDYFIIKLWTEHYDDKRKVGYLPRAAFPCAAVEGRLWGMTRRCRLTELSGQ
jgi:hypothetical protein